MQDVPLPISKTRFIIESAHESEFYFQLLFLMFANYLIYNWCYYKIILYFYLTRVVSGKSRIMYRCHTIKLCNRYEKGFVELGSITTTYIYGHTLCLNLQ